MKVLYTASEAIPFIATGGLADVAGSLPKALKSKKIECRVVVPLYSDISDELRSKMCYVTDFDVTLAWRRQYCGVFEAEDNGVTYYFLDNEYYFKRKGIYAHYDDAERFTFFSRAVLEMIKYIDFKPDIIHANDWHTALIPAFLKVMYRDSEEYRNIKTVFTIHNVQYQGIYGMDLLEEILGIPQESYSIFEYRGNLNFMKAGIVTADAVTTVSPTYAQELKNPYFAYGMDPIFNLISNRLTGILNGIDYNVYNPKTDAEISSKYNAYELNGKAENRKSLQRMFQLPEEDDAFIIAVVSRLVETKGIDLIRSVMDEILQHHVQFILLGKGDWIYENYFSELARKYPGKVAVRIGFINDIAHKIYAGADALLMPSKTEPCGLSQMVAMRYGTIPVIHETGGLKDSVRDCGNKEGNGFTFQTYNAEDMLDAISRAETMFRDRESWQKIVQHDMVSDFSWKNSAKSYKEIYDSISISH